jgi:membrane protein implicated in regulation of membrane protease activity
VKRRTSIVLGLVLSIALCAAATSYLVAVGARIATQVVPLSPAETYFTCGGLLVGVLGLAVFLGLALRRADPAAAHRPAGTIQRD